MKRNPIALLLGLLLLLVLSPSYEGKAQEAAFTYQGLITVSGTPANGQWDMQFKLYDAASAGNQVGTSLAQAPIAVTNGLFTVTLNFGAGAFDGSARWLEIGLRPNGSASPYAVMSPRPAVTSTPYAIQAANAATAAIATVANSANAVAATNITGTIEDAQLSENVALLTGSAAFAGEVTATAFNGNGAGLTNVDLVTIDSRGVITWITNSLGFASASTLSVGSYPFSVTSADVNGDGWVDLISANYGANTLSVQTNNGSGGFAIASTLSMAGPRSVTSADVNGDGWIDLISANGASTLSVRTNNGSGGFAIASTPSVGDGSFVTSADVNGDGWVDLISANHSAHTLSVLTNNGSGDFASASTLSVGINPNSVTSADVNGDGWVDLISANHAVGKLSVLTNNGSGGFANASTPSVGSGPRSVTSADVNGDGWVDLISANSLAHTLSVLTNNGSGGFASASTLSVGDGPMSVTSADVNGDGWVDLISANIDDDTLSVMTNDGSGGFASASTLSVGDGPMSVTSADVNGDGWVDLISANRWTNTLSVLTNSVEIGANFFGRNANFTGTTIATNAGNQFAGTFLGNGGLLTNVNAALLNGFSSSAFLGATAKAVDADKLDNVDSTQFARKDIAETFASSVAASSFSGNGAGLTGLNASSLSGGTVNDARLSANVALLGASQTFSGLKTFSGSNTFAGPVSFTGTNIFANTNHFSGTNLFSGSNIFSGPVRFAGTNTFASSNFFSGTNIFTNAANSFAGSFTGNGAGITNLNALNIASGMLSAAILPGNLAQISSNYFAGDVGIGATNPAGSLEVREVLTFGESIDQENPDSGGGVDVGSVWQSFTAGADGLLTKISLYTSYNYPNIVIPVEVKIYQGEGTSGTLLGTGSFSIPKYGGQAYRTCTISPQISVTNGSQYTIYADPALNTFFYRSDSNAYPGGRASIDPQKDFMFRTYVIPPSRTNSTLLVNNGKVGVGTNAPSTEFEVVGTAKATHFVGNGTGLTDLNADNLSSGIVNLARLSSQVITNQKTGVTLSGTFSGNGSGLTSLSLAALPSQVVTNQKTGVTLSGAFSGNGSGLINLSLTALPSQVVTNEETGVTLSGVFNGDGAGLTNLNASNLSTGIVTLARLPSEVVTNQATGITLSGAFNGDGAGLTSLNASNLSGGTVTLARLPSQVVTNQATGITLSGAFSGSGSGLTSLNASSLISGTMNLLRLPNEVITNNKVGVTLSGSFSGTGSGLTGLNADNLASGTVNDARLSANVPLLDASQTFTGTNYFNAPVSIGTGAPQGDIDIKGTLVFQTSNMGSSAQSQRIFFDEAAVSDEFGFSLVYNALNSGSPTFNGTSMPLERDSFNIVRHDGDAVGIPALTVKRGSGFVGIGETSPDNTLHVTSSLNVAGIEGHVALIENTNTGTSANGLAIKVGNTGNPSANQNFITFYQGNDASIGSIQGNGSGSVVLGGAGSDYAEFLPKIDPAEEIKPGDVVGVFNGKISKRTQGAAWVMALSSNPIVQGNDPGEEKRGGYGLVGFVGQVRVHVRGSVTAGDYIVASAQEDGTAVAVSPGTIQATQEPLILGRAWESSTEPGVKLVNTVVGLSHASSTTQALAKSIQLLQNENASLKKQLTAQSQVNQKLEARFESMEKVLETIQAKVPGAEKAASAERPQDL